MMVKINWIKTLKVTKILFFIFLISTFAIFFALDVMCFIKPHFIQANWCLSVSGYISDPINITNTFTNFHLDPSYIIFYSFGILSLVIMIILFLIIKFNGNYIFNDNNCSKLSLVAIILMILFFILSSCVLFAKPVDVIAFNEINKNWIKINGLFSYIINKNQMQFSFLPGGIASIFFFCLETIILFLIIIYFSYKIIKKKYI